MANQFTCEIESTSRGVFNAVSEYVSKNVNTKHFSIFSYDFDSKKTENQNPI